MECGYHIYFYLGINHCWLKSLFSKDNKIPSAQRASECCMCFSVLCILKELQSNISPNGNSWAYIWSHLHSQCALPCKNIFDLLLSFANMFYSHYIRNDGSRKEWVFRTAIFHVDILWNIFLKFLFSSFKKSCLGFFYVSMSRRVM